MPVSYGTLQALRPLTLSYHMSSVFPRRQEPSSDLLSGLPLDMEPNERKLRKNSLDAVGCDVAWALPLLSSIPLVDLTLGIDLT